MQTPKFSKSAPIAILPYKDKWPQEFQQISKQLKETLGPSALRIDHIGSTAVPGLSAKDVIDIQITIATLSDLTVIELLVTAGYNYRSTIKSDNYLGETAKNDPQLEKRLCCEQSGNRRANIHIRQEGNFNQQFPILFRDYLRAVPEVQAGYQLLKERLAEIFPESIEGYLFIKEPAMGLIYEGARKWAAAVNWKIS